MRTLLAVVALVAVACGSPSDVEGQPCERLNEIACVSLEYFQCVCDKPTCNPGDPGVWKPLGDACP